MTAESHKSTRYNARQAEVRQQKNWDERGTFATKSDASSAKYYVFETLTRLTRRTHKRRARNHIMGDGVRLLSWLCDFEAEKASAWFDDLASGRVRHG